MTTPAPVAPAASVRMTRPTYGRPAPLPPRRHPWIRNTTLVLGAAGGICTAGPALGVDHWAVPAAAAGLVLAAGGVAVDGYYRQQRQQDLDRCAEQLCAVLGIPPTRAVLWAHSWKFATRRGAIPTRPGRIVVRYTNAGAELDPDWLTRVDDVISGQSWGTYRLERHNRRRCRLVYVLDDSPAPVADPESVARAKRLILKILGPTAVITGTELDSNGVVSRIQAHHDDGVRFAPSGYRDRVERTISAVLPGRWRARWDLVGDTVVFEVRPAFPEIIWHRSASDPTISYDKVAVAFAQDEDGNVMVWRPCIDPHFIFIGATGTGKTAAVHTVLTDIAARGWMCWVVDGKGMEFIGFRTWPNVQVVASRMEHQVAVIHRAWEEMETRYAAIEEGASEEDFTPILLVVDEFADFRGNLENWYSMIKVKGDPTRPQTLLEIASLVRKGRSARIHLVFSTQRPDADFFSGRGQGDTRDSLRMRVSLGPLSPQGAMMLWYSPATGTTIPRGIRGRATGVNDDNEPVEIQCFYTPDPRRTQPDTTGHDVLTRLRPAQAVHDRLVILDPDTEDDDDLDAEEDLPRPRRRQPESIFRKTAAAPWGWAADFPDHDPVHRRAQLAAARPADPEPLLGLSNFLTRRPGPASSPAPATERDTHARRAHTSSASTPRSMSTLLTAAASAATAARPRLRLVTEPDEPPTPTSTPVGEDVGGADWDGYGDPELVAPLDAAVGDLILDDTTGQWGVIDGDPEPDLLAGDDALIAITFRTAADGEELLSIPASGEVTIRRPLDFVPPSA